MSAARWLAVLLVALGGAVWRGPTAGAAPAPVMFQSAPGQFEVAAVDVGGAQRVVARAVEAWQLLATPLALPGAFASPVLVRLVPAAEWGERTPFRVIVETGGIVSVRLRWDEATPESFVRRSLVQGLLMRQAVARHGVNAHLTAPLWLEHAGVGWWRTHAEPAQLDALKQSSAGRAPPTLAELLNWQRGAEEPERFIDGAVWLLAFLQTDSGKAGEWPALLQRLLGGEAPEAALAASYPGRFASERERELWWQTGWHHLRRARVLPAFEAAESRAELAELARFVFTRNGSDAVVPLGDVLAHAREPRVAADLKRRAAALNRVLTALHPFYRNAGLSLAEVLTASGATPERRAAWGATFEQDWRDANELAAASAAALDALEAKLTRTP